MEQLPIGLTILSGNQVLFANKEFGSIFRMNDKFPIYNPDTIGNDKILKVLTNIRSDDNQRGLSQLKGDILELYKYDQIYIRILDKQIQYGSKMCDVICCFEVTQLRQLENEKNGQEIPNTAHGHHVS